MPNQNKIMPRTPSATAPPTIASWWHGWRMSWLEQVCLRSFVAKGHKVILYTNGEVDNIPEGVEQRPDTEIWNPGKLITYQGKTMTHLKGSIALHSDLFRYHLLNKTDYIWVDTDAYCHQPFPDEPWLFARHEPHPKSLIATGVLRLPKDSETLKLLVETFAGENYEYPILPWKSKRSQFGQRLLKKLGHQRHVSELAWSTPGPSALMKFLEMTGEISHAMPWYALYPLPFYNSHFILDDEETFIKHIPHNCLSVHLYTTHLLTHYNHLLVNPPKNSWLAMRAHELNIDPAEAPEAIKLKPPSQTIDSAPKNKNEILTIAAWWTGWRMSWIEQVCLLSYVDQGHKVILYTNGEVDNVPDGVEQRPDTEIWNPGRLVTYEGSYKPSRGSPALHSDLFRYHLLHKTDYAWIDTDAYCHQRFPNQPWLFGESILKQGLRIDCGVLRLPHDSQTLQLLMKTFLDNGGEYPILPWKSERWQSRQRWRKKLGLGIHISRMEWGSVGPLGVTNCLKITDEIHHHMPTRIFYPFPLIVIQEMAFRDKKVLEQHLPDDCLSIHLFTSNLHTNKATKHHVLDPPKNSWLGARARELGIDPACAPDRIKVKPHDI